MNIIEHLSRTVTPVLLNGVNDAEGNRASLLEKIYAIIVARLADDHVANGFANTTVANDDVGFFDRFLPQLSHRNDMVHQLSNHYSVSEQETSSLMSRAAPMVYNELRNLAGTQPLPTFLRSHLSSISSHIPAWAYAFLPAGILTAMNLHAPATNATTTQRVVETTKTEHLVPVVEKKGMNPLLPLIGLLILGALAWALLKGCEKKPEPVKPVQVASAPASTVAVTSSAAAVTSATSTTTTTTTTQVISTTEPSVFFENGHLKFYFVTGKADVAPGAVEKAKEILAAAKSGTILGISGYTDSTGDKVANEKLSKDRAEAVKAFLVANGVPADHLKLVKPADSVGATGKDQEGRRVEVYAIGTDGKEIALPGMAAVGHAVGSVASATGSVVGGAASALTNAAKDVGHATAHATDKVADATKAAGNAAANAGSNAVTATKEATTTTTTTNKSN